MMKKYWRKMMALTCAAAMLFTMAGCGNAEGTTDGAAKQKMLPGHPFLLTKTEVASCLVRVPES